MIQKNITPTKSNYIYLKEELTLSKEGHVLLEQKREVLIMNLTNLVSKIQEAREQLDNKLFEIFSQLSLVRLESGSVMLDLIINSVAQDYEVDIIPHTIMGVVASKLVLNDSQNQNKSQVPMGISGTSPNFDKLFQMTQQIKPIMAEVAYLESTAWKLITEIKKTQRRINALENFVIPTVKDTMKFISEILEEKDRETLFQIKRIKAKKIKKQALKQGVSYDV